MPTHAQEPAPQEPQTPPIPSTAEELRGYLSHLLQYHIWFVQGPPSQEKVDKYIGWVKAIFTTYSEHPNLIWPQDEPKRQTQGIFKATVHLPPNQRIQIINAILPFWEDRRPEFINGVWEDTLFYLFGMSPQEETGPQTQPIAPVNLAPTQAETQSHQKQSESPPEKHLRQLTETLTHIILLAPSDPNKVKRTTSKAINRYVRTFPPEKRLNIQVSLIKQFMQIIDQKESPDERVKLIDILLHLIGALPIRQDTTALLSEATKLLLDLLHHDPEFPLQKIRALYAKAERMPPKDRNSIQANIAHAIMKWLGLDTRRYTQLTPGLRQQIRTHSFHPTPPEPQGTLHLSTISRLITFVVASPLSLEQNPEYLNTLRLLLSKYDLTLPQNIKNITNALNEASRLRGDSKPNVSLLYEILLDLVWSAIKDELLDPKNEIPANVATIVALLLFQAHKYYKMAQLSAPSAHPRLPETLIKRAADTYISLGYLEFLLDLTQRIAYDLKRVIASGSTVSLIDPFEKILYILSKAHRLHSPYRISLQESAELTRDTAWGFYLLLTRIPPPHKIKPAIDELLTYASPRAQFCIVTTDT